MELGTNMFWFSNNGDIIAEATEINPTFALKAGHYQFELTVTDTTTNDSNIYGDSGS